MYLEQGYLSHWGIDRSPFRTSVDAEHAYPTAPLDEATARIEYLVAQRRRVGALLGERGVGKSTTLWAAADRLAEAGAVAVVIDAYGLSRRELLWQTAEGLAAGPDPADDEPRLWRRLRDRVLQNKWQGADTVFLVDDCDAVAADLLRQLVRLSRLDPAADARQSLIVTLCPEHLAQLDETLLHAIDLRVDLYPWTLDDTIGYVQNAVFDAGRMSPAFDDDAIARLHDLTQGLPRHIARLADHALLIGASAECEVVTPAEIEQAFHDISWAPPAAV